MWKKRSNVQGEAGCAELDAGIAHTGRFMGAHWVLGEPVVRHVLRACPRERCQRPLPPNVEGRPRAFDE